MASLPPLGEVAVDVTANLTKLFTGLADAKSASERFERSLSQNLGRSAQAAARQVNLVGDAGVKLARDFRPAMAAADRFGRSMQDAGRKSERAGQQIRSSAENVRRTLLTSAAAITAAFGAREIMQLADSYTSFTNRIRSAGVEGTALAAKQRELAAIANQYGVELGAIGELYGRVSQAQNDLGASTREIMVTVEGAAAAVRVYGASTAEQAGAIRQLSQLLGNAKVQMQEFNSLNDGARPLLVAVATGIDRFGGSVSRLRAEIMRGGFESKEFFAGLQRGLPAIIEQANQMPLTIGASFQVLNNKLGEYIGQTDQAWSATQRIGGAIRALANNLSVIMPILTAIVLAIGARLLAALGASTVAMVRQTAASATAAIAATALAATQGRVTTMLGATTIATGAYSGSLGVVTLTANAAALSLTRMQVVLATAGAMATRVGAALLAAFGGWVGVSIFAIVGAVLLYNRSMAAAEEQVRKFNENHENAVRLLREEAQNTRTANTEVRQLGQAHQTATTHVQAFAGATGDAADALHRQAVEARAARLEILRTAAAASRASYNELNTQMTARADTLMRRRVATPYQNDPEWQDMNRRAQIARRDAERLEAARDAAEGRPLESWAGPNVRSQGRNLPAEIAERRAQLLVAERNHNEALQRQLLREIRLRERIIALMETSLNFENAQAQANAEQLRAPGTGPGRFTSRTQAIGIAGRELQGLGLNVGENVQFGGVRGRHTYAQHGQNAIDINMGTGTIEANDPSARARFDALALQYQRRGFRILWNNRIYEPGGDGPGGSIEAANRRRAARGQAQISDHRNHMHMEAPGSIVGRSMGRDSVAEAEAAMEAAAERAEEERIRNERQFTDELAAINSDILNARRDQSVDAAAIAQLERDRIGIERDRQKTEIESRHELGQYTDAQRDQALAANEQLRTLQLTAVDLRERERVIQESLRTATATNDREMEVLQAQQDLARTAVQRRAVERRILAAQEEQERRLLQAIIDSPTSSPLDRQIAQADQAALGRRYGARRGGLDRQARDDLLGTAPEGSETARRQEMESIREREEERLAIVQEALDRRIISEEEAARRRVEIENDAQSQMRDAQIAADVSRLQSAQATADSLAQIAQALFGEHSRAARAMFIVSKGFAIAEAVLQIQVALAKALALGFPQNIPAIAAVAALGASIVSNIVAITGQFEGGGWTGGTRGKPAGMVHGEEFVVRAGPAALHRPLLESMNAGRDPTAALRRRGAGAPLMGGGNMRVAIHNHAPGVEHEARQIGPGEMEIIARRVVQREAPGVVAADMNNPNSRTSKAVQRTTTARPRRA